MGLLGLVRQAICPVSSVRVLLLLAYVLLLCTHHHRTQAENSACARGCMNGGQMLLPNNIFGFCRCRCPQPFLGPKCQFMSKRSASMSRRRDLVALAQELRTKQDAMKGTLPTEWLALLAKLQRLGNYADGSD